MVRAQAEASVQRKRISSQQTNLAGRGVKCVTCKSEYLCTEFLLERVFSEEQSTRLPEQRLVSSQRALLKGPNQEESSFILRRDCKSKEFCDRRIVNISVLL